MPTVWGDHRPLVAGICHAPFATARAMLVEHGWGALQLLVTDAEGVLSRPSAEALMPGLPTAFDDFRNELQQSSGGSEGTTGTGAVPRSLTSCS